MNKMGYSTDDWFYSRQHNLLAMDNDALMSEFNRSACFYRALLGDSLPIDKEARILDLPCGEGKMLYALRAMGYKHISGCDLDINRLNTARKMDLAVHEGNVFDVLQKSEDNSIDCLFTMDFLEHLEKEDVIVFLDIVFRKMAIGGILFVRTPCADNPFGLHDIFNDFTHKWAATSGVLHQLLYNSGFSAISVFGEEPRLGMRLGFLRVPMHRMASLMLGLFLRALGRGPFRISSSSMWATARKNDVQR